MLQKAAEAEPQAEPPLAPTGPVEMEGVLWKRGSGTSISSPNLNPTLTLTPTLAHSPCGPVALALALTLTLPTDH